jgi:hypothetical protein
LRGDEVTVDHAWRPRRDRIEQAQDHLELVVEAVDGFPELLTESGRTALKQPGQYLSPICARCPGRLALSQQRQSGELRVAGRRCEAPEYLNEAIHDCGCYVRVVFRGRALERRPRQLALDRYNRPFDLRNLMNLWRGEGQMVLGQLGVEDL